jgi:AraC-like DNA-binding protein
MVFSTTALQPAVTIQPISDMTDADSCPDLIQQERMSLEAAPLHAQRVVVRLPSISMIFHATDRRIQTRTQIRDGMSAFVAFGPRSAGTVDGIAVDDAKLLVAGSGTEARLIVEPGYESVSLLAAPDEIGRHLRNLRRADDLRPPCGVQILSVGRDAARNIFVVGRRIAAAATASPQIFNRDRPESPLAQAELLDALFAALDTTAPIEPQGPEKTHLTHDRIVRLAEDYVVTRLSERVHIADVCCVTDVSERTLEMAFRNITGLSPVAYFIRLRLHRARDALLKAEPGSTRVSEQALKFGFWHFGEFSSAYKRCFGESPSDTLKRAPSGAHGQHG